MLICIFILIIKGIVVPIGSIAKYPLIENVLARGIKDGYQTMDALGACVFAVLVINSVKEKHYTSEKAIFKATVYAGLAALVGLGVIYGSLCYLGAQVSGSGQFNMQTNQTYLIVTITEMVLGSVGKVVLGAIVGLACLTTAIGLTSSSADFFDELLGYKFGYKKLVAVLYIFSAIISNFGVSEIIKLSAPILGIVYPCAIIVIILGLFNKYIKHDIVYKIPTYIALLMGLLDTLLHNGTVLSTKFGVDAFIAFDKLPLTKFGFNWLVPVLIGLIIAIGIAVHSESVNNANGAEVSS